MSTNSIKRYDNELPVKKASGAAFRSVTAAVKAAVREKEEARAYKLATEKLMVEAEARLRAANVCWVESQRCTRLWCIIFVVLLLLNAAVGIVGIISVL